MRRLFAVALATLWPALAHACAVCGSPNDRNRMAFFWTMVLLSLLPLALMAGGLYYLRRVGGARLAGEFLDRDAAPPAVAVTTAPAPAETR